MNGILQCVNCEIAVACLPDRVLSDLPHPLLVLTRSCRHFNPFVIDDESISVYYSTFYVLCQYFMFEVKS